MSLRAVYPQMPDIEVKYDFSYNLHLPASQVRVTPRVEDCGGAPAPVAPSTRRPCSRCAARLVRFRNGPARCTSRHGPNAVPYFVVAPLSPVGWMCSDAHAPALSRPRQVNHEIPTVVGKFKELLLTPVAVAKEVGRIAKREPDTSMQTVSILSNCKGALRPGSTTLLLAPPGHGKTSFLKALAGRLPTGALDGSVTYSGLDQRELLSKGMYLKLLANYVDQLDVHLPFLTVRETAEVRRQRAGAFLASLTALTHPPPACSLRAPIAPSTRA